jgi:5-methylcytosine-specific restriction endonuclease McrA
MSKILLSKLKTNLENGNLVSFVKESFSVSQVLLALGYQTKGQYISIVRKYLLDNNIDTCHFTSTGKPTVPMKVNICLNCNKEFKTENSARPQYTCSRSCANTYFRTGKHNPLWKSGIGSYRTNALKFYGSKCMICGIDNIAVLQVHHKDKNRYNNEVSNLQILCANCHLLVHQEIYRFNRSLGTIIINDAV